MPPRVLIGKHPDTAEIGMWISKPTKNARTSTNEADFLFSPAIALARPFAKLTMNAYSRGTFVRTVSGGGFSEDRYLWRASYFHNFGIVPHVVTQLAYENNVNSPWVDAAGVYLESNEMAAFNYVTGDASKTPVTIQNYQNGSPWGYNVTTQKMVYVGNTTIFTIYRNPIS